MTVLEHDDTEPPDDDPADAPERDDGAPDYPAWLEDYLESDQALEDWPHLDESARYEHELERLRSLPPPDPPPAIPMFTNVGSACPHDDFYIDWADFWNTDHDTHDWLYEPILAHGRAHAIWAGHKIGKSLVVLWIATQLATKRDDVIVVYFDYEMTPDDLYERLSDMGYGPESDLAHLYYAQLPDLGPLDTPKGARALIDRLAELQRNHPDRHLCVILDTTSRALQGEENDADTYRDYYRHTGLALKALGITAIRLDHAGKDKKKGQRGSSGKGDDVDVVWQLDEADEGYVLKRSASRLGWIPEKVPLHRVDDPLRFVHTAAEWPAGTKDAAETLDRLGVPVDASVRACRAALLEAKETASQIVLAAAVRFRRDSP